MDKRINILFDHLNNDDLLKPDTVQTMIQISECVRDKQWEQAQQMFTEMQMTKGENEGGVWMVSLVPLVYLRLVACGLTFWFLGRCQETHCDWQSYEAIDGVGYRP